MGIFSRAQLSSAGLAWGLGFDWVAKGETLLSKMGETGAITERVMQSG